MTIGDHLKEFYGLRVVDFPDAADKKKALPAAGSVAWRIGVEAWDAKGPWAESFARFLDTVDATRVRALIVGMWKDTYDNSPDDVIEALTEAREQLPALRAIFLGDITYDECEISWIQQGLVSPLLEAFPALQEFGVRGGQNLVFTALEHENLRKLVVQTGGLPGEVAREIANSELPALTHLELWLGTSQYGGDTEIPELAPIFAGTNLPSLKYLGLRNSEIQDEVCAALATAPVVARLTELDISMGVLTDDGAAALLSGQPLGHLKSLDMHHNYLSMDMRDRLRQTLEPSGVLLNLDEDGAEEDEDEDEDQVWRFVAVGE
ncbi:STM4015 family protein [Nocardia crassostreae]|uniref:STM4015 family protein n=1 Tax=Nocardia crassostreae TaxID=53428 RepID=UPI00082ED66E|nr:STM4015 family protein [Nocardia crassostreae]